MGMMKMTLTLTTSKLGNMKSLQTFLALLISTYITLNLRSFALGTEFLA